MEQLLVLSHTWVLMFILCAPYCMRVVGQKLWPGSWGFSSTSAARTVVQSPTYEKQPQKYRRAQ